MFYFYLFSKYWITLFTIFLLVHCTYSTILFLLHFNISYVLESLWVRGDGGGALSPKHVIMEPLTSVVCRVPRCTLLSVPIHAGICLPARLVTEWGTGHGARPTLPEAHRRGYFRGTILPAAAVYPQLLLLSEASATPLLRVSVRVKGGGVNIITLYSFFFLLRVCRGSITSSHAA